MANEFSNIRHDVSNLVGCRYCNRFFTNTQTLATHIESHMEYEEAAIRKLYSTEHINPKRQFPPQCLPPHDGKIFQPKPTVIRPHPSRNPFFGHVGYRQMQLPPHVNQSKHLEGQSSNDGTKAYIKQLEKPIKKIDFIDLVNNDDDNPDVNTLDLSLKL